MQLRKVQYEGAQPIQLLFCDPARGDIGMGESRVSSDRLLTTGVATCIVVAAHNQETRRGLLGHFVTLSTDEAFSDKDSFHAALDDIAHLGNPLMTSVFLGGGTPFISEDDGQNVVTEDRRYAEEETRKLCAGFKLPSDQVIVEWSELGRAIDIELSCVEGVLVVHNSPKDAFQLVHAPASPETS